MTASTDRGGLALFRDQELLFEKSWTRQTQQSEALTFFLDKALRSHDLSVKDLTHLVLDVGPGSFTGCRIAANIAKTIAQELKLSIYTATSLDILLFQLNRDIPGHTFARAIIDAQKSLFYTLDDTNKEIRLLSEEEVMTNGGSPPFIFGVFSSPFRKVLKDRKFKFSSKNSLNFPRPSTLGYMFSQSSNLLTEKPWQEVEPLYIRAPDAVEKLRIKN